MTTRRTRANVRADKIMMSIVTAPQSVQSEITTDALHAAMFNSTNFSSIATDATGVIRIFNAGAERMLGYAAADVLNAVTIVDLVDPPEMIGRATRLSAEFSRPIAPGFEALVFKASRGIEDNYELTCIRKDGSPFPAIISVTALRNTQDAIIGYLLIGTDNTARKAVDTRQQIQDQRLRGQNAELEITKAAAETANRAKSDFLSSMSHELRTPLNAILGFTQLMETGNPPPTIVQKRSIDQILKAGWYLLDLINEILDLAQIESGKLLLSLEPVSIGEVMLECRTMMEEQASRRGVVMTFPRIDVPLFVKADRMRIKQILLNLLSNAIKYNRIDGSVIVECIVSSPDLVRMVVRDNGDGLPPEKLAMLFQPFNRLGQEANAEQGTGIGLVVCRRLVELMGGRIGVESVVGKGSEFWIEMKLTDASPSGDIKHKKARVVPATRMPGARLHTLLYVEDNPANMMLVEDIIASRRDMRLLSATDGRQGIEIARSCLPDVILMDLNLPVISGVQALGILAADPTTAHIPVIALSANAMPRDIEQALAAGFIRYITKPIRVGELMDALDLALKFAIRRD